MPDRAGPARLVRLLPALLGALVAVALAPVAAGAHATLGGSAPASGERLQRPPGRVVLRFSEPVEAAFGTVRVVDAHGRRADARPALHPRPRKEEGAVRRRRGGPPRGHTRPLPLDWGGSPPGHAGVHPR